MTCFTVQSMKNGYRYNLKAGNGQVIASSRPCDRVEDCLRGIEQVRACRNAPVEDQTLHAFPVHKYPKYLLRGDPHSGFSFTLCGPDGALLMYSKHYTAKRSCQSAILSMCRSLAIAQVLVEEEPE